MKKIKIFLIIIIAIVGALLIYYRFENENNKKEVIDKFVSEYTLVKDDHIFQTINIDNSLNILNQNTGIIFFCDPGSQWCQYYAKLLDEISEEIKIEKIYYLDIKEDRSLNSTNYLKVVDKLNGFLSMDDTGNKRLNMPNVTFVKNGIVIANDNETSIISSDIIPEDYWTNENMLEFKERIKQYNQLLLEEDIITVK